VPDRAPRLAFLGTPAAAVPALQALHAAGHEIALVVSNPDRRRGRGGASSPSPVKAAATALGLPVSHDLADVVGSGAELGVVVAYGQLLPDELLDAVPMVNLHFSLLPRWRGAAPVERAILAGDERTGVCLMAIEPALDTGPVFRRAEVAIGPDETADELRARLADVGAAMLVEALADGLGEPEAQEGEATYARKLTVEERQLDWVRPAVELHRVVRVGGAWTTVEGRRLKVWQARLAPLADGADGADAADPAEPADGAAPAGLAPGELRGPWVGTGDGALELVEVQPEGRARTDAGSWLRGARLPAGVRLGATT
jgi:methionyl-tRNA formyltransferase